MKTFLTILALVVSMNNLKSESQTEDEIKSELTKSFSTFSDNIVPDLFKTIEASSKYLKEMHVDLKTGQTEIKETVLASKNEIKADISKLGEGIEKLGDIVQINDKKEQAYLDRETRYILKIDKLKEKNRKIMDQFKNDQLEKNKILQASKEKDVALEKERAEKEKERAEKEKALEKVEKERSEKEKERSEKEKALEKVEKIELYLKSRGIDPDTI